MKPKTIKEAKDMGYMVWREVTYYTKHPKEDHIIRLPGPWPRGW